MSKSLGNYVGINESAKEMFGKLMSISDDLMWKYYELLTDEDVGRIKADVNSGRLHPKKVKAGLAKSIVSQYHSKAEADRQAEEFDRAFKDKGFPQDIELRTVQAKADPEPLLNLLVEGSRILPSRAEAKRKIQEGAVEIDGVKITDVSLTLIPRREYRIRVGKRFARIFLKK
jgi:tyrosyl-tRNA synthetase